MTFSAPLPDYARYLIRLTGVKDVAGNALLGDNDRIVTALLGDATADRRVNSTDVCAVQSLRGIDPINAADVNQVRSDVTNDGRVNNTDVGGVLSVRGKDARFIPDPVATGFALTRFATTAKRSKASVTSGAATPVLLVAPRTTDPVETLLDVQSTITLPPGPKTKALFSNRLLSGTTVTWYAPA